MELIEISRRLCRRVSKLRFADPVAYVYNPLQYARAPGEAYLERFGGKKGRIVLIGMNPGPFGMAQTGVPFGEVSHVRDWMGIEGRVTRPKHEHPKRPIEGFACPRSEVSGARLWGWAAQRFGDAETFFSRFFVTNYCPLAFLEETGRNRIPEKLPVEERNALFAVCDEALRDTIAQLEPERVVGIGTFAQRRAHKVLADLGYEVGSVLHPSPASPKANRGWSAAVEQDFKALDIDLHP